jgi:hypothetical protein
LEYVPARTRVSEAVLRGQSDEAKDASIVLATLTGRGKISDDKWAAIIRNVMRQRRLFATQDGHFGIGPMKTRPDDVVVIISGCNFPIVLRAIEDKFEVVGEAYGTCFECLRMEETRLTCCNVVHGRMNGEGLARTWYRPWVSAWEEISLV